MKEHLLNMLPRRIYLELNWWNFKRLHKEQFREMQLRRNQITEDGYSFQPFDTKKAIFVHIPKCGGISINKTIFGCLAGGHTTFQEYLTIFKPKEIIDYFKFTFVRNPWDRLVSAYFFLKSGGFNEADRTWFEKELSSFSSFNEFVKKWLNKSNIWKGQHFIPQHHYMFEKRNKIQLDFIGFLENIEDDFNYVTKQICTQDTLPNLNKSKHSTYIDYYDKETEKIVADVYSEDIKFFGYNFDNSNLGKQIDKRNSLL